MKGLGRTKRTRKGR